VVVSAVGNSFAHKNFVRFTQTNLRDPPRGSWPHSENHCFKLGACV